MTTGRVLTRNTIYSILGQVIPLVAALVAIRILIPGLGDVRFGILTLAWGAAGYFAIFDFGLARAMTHAVAARLAVNETDDLGDVAWTALAAMFALGVVGMLLGMAATPALVDVLKVPPEYRDECRRAFFLIALSVPWMVSTGGFRGLLEAHQHFGVATLLRIPLAITAFLGPVVAMQFTSRLEPIMILLVAGRFVVWALHLAACLRAYPFLRRRFQLRWTIVKPLATFGGWTTLTNIVVPLMTQFDRFAVAAILAVDAATYYVPPFEIATKLWIIPVAVAAVLFPTLTSTFLTDRARTIDLIDKGVRAIAALLFPITLVLVVFAPEILAIWIPSSAVAEQGVPVLRWLGAGAFAIAVGHVLLSAVQGAGRPDLIAKVQFAQLPFYWGALWWCTNRYGLPGVAIASAARMVIDTAIFHVIVPLEVPGSGAVIARAARRGLVLLVVLVLAPMPDRLIVRSALAALILIGFGVYTWTFLIRSAERGALARSFGLARGGERVVVGP